MKTLILVVLLLSAASAFLSCKSTEFAEKKQPQDLALTDGRYLNFKCEDFGKGPERVELNANEISELRVKAEICDDITVDDEKTELNVFLLLDSSGSMVENDPTVGKTCGRMKALKELVSNPVFSQYGRVRISIFGFSTNGYDIVRQLNIKQMTDVDDYQVCGHKGHTNYHQAFDMAYKIVKDKTSRNLIFLISDGLPTRPLGHYDNYPADRGKETAQKILTETSSSIYAIYLQTAKGAVNKFDASPVKDPFTYLTSLTGSADQVTNVNSADQLAEKIRQFTDSFNHADGIHQPNVLLEASGSSVKRFEINETKKVSDNPPKWVMTTRGLTPLGKTDETLVNRVKLTITKKDGTKTTAVKDVYLKQ